MDLNVHGEERDILSRKYKDWIDGRAVKLNLTGEDVVDSFGM